jgi:hypothetical protein
MDAANITLGEKFSVYPGRTIALFNRLMDAIDRFDQPSILPLSTTFPALPPGVIAAARDPQDPAQHLDRIWIAADRRKLHGR